MGTRLVPPGGWAGPMTPSTRYAKYLSIFLLISLLFAFPNRANSADTNPLRPVDTSSPKATLQGFVGTMDEIYRGYRDILQEYAGSERLYLTPDERRKQFEVLSAAAKAIKVLDLSDIPPVLRDTVAPERAIQLKEVLDRIEFPSFESIPDQDAMARASSKRWRLPGTEIDIGLIENGPRSGEYLVSAGAVDRLPEFYERVKKLPYKPGPGAELSDVYRRMTSGGTATIYDGYSNSPAGLERIIPPRWMLNFPAWAKAQTAGIASWQWLGFLSGLAVCVGFVYGLYRLGRFLASRRPEEVGPGWRALLSPLAIVLVSAVPVPALCAIFRIGGTARVVITVVQAAALYLSAAWLSFIAASLLAEAIVASEHLRRGSLDSQLIRLGMRLAGLAIAIGFLIQGSWGWASRPIRSLPG
jgi:MscS family membrane protein